MHRAGLEPTISIPDTTRTLDRAAAVSGVNWECRHETEPCSIAHGQ
jgi:hypothetical protein